MRHRIGPRLPPSQTSSPRHANRPPCTNVQTPEELIDRTPADGLVSGLGTVNGALFDHQHSRCAIVGYDYTVLAGTQGFINHRKKDRLFDIVERLRLPVVLFAEGGGGRPGDTDAPGVAGLDVMSFATFARLSGLADDWLAS